MDTGTRSSAQATQYLRSRAPPKQIEAAAPPPSLPSTSVQQLRQRAEAELASQQLLAPKENVRADLVQQREGELIARRKAAQRMNFQKFDAHVQNMSKVLSAQYAAGRASDVAQATSEVMQMGNSLGTAHAELRPQTRQDIENRAMQLKHLVGSQFIDAQLDAGRKLQNQYAIRNRNDAVARAVLGGSVATTVRAPSSIPTTLDLGRYGFDSGYLPVPA